MVTLTNRRANEHQLESLIGTVLYTASPVHWAPRQLPRITDQPQTPVVSMRMLCGLLLQIATPRAIIATLLCVRSKARQSAYIDSAGRQGRGPCRGTVNIVSKE
jgi:hypothetical protein